jgi:predicted permease
MSIQRDIDAELRFHFKSRIDDLVSQGMSREAAREQAIAEFGDVDRVRNGLREIDRRVAKRRDRMERLDAVLADLRYAARSLRRSPAVSLTIILTLALGIGVNAAMFSLLDAIYLRPPAGVAEPQVLRRLWVERRFVSGVQYWPGFDYQAFDAVSRAGTAQAEAFAYAPPSKMTIGRGENAPTLRVVRATGEYFRLLGVKAARGRVFDVADARPETSAPVVVISDALWSRQFNRAPDVVGQTLTIGRTPLTIIGVAPAEFRGIDLDAADAWTPLGAFNSGNAAQAWWRNPNVNGFSVVLRLKSTAREGELLQRLMPAIRAIEASGLRYDSLSVAAFGAINRERGPGKVSGEMQVATRLACVAIVVLLIAAANVVNLLLARGMKRRREIAVRLALGISRSRLTRLLVCESVLLAVAASGAALVAARWAVALIQHLLMPDVQWAGQTIHWRLVAFALGVATVCGIVTGLVPAWQVSSPTLTDGLRAGARDTHGGRSALRSGLVVVQAALSVVLLGGAALFVRSLANVKAHDVGYAVERLAFGGVSYDTRDSVRDAALPMRIAALAPRVKAIGGVRDVAFTSMRPMWGWSSRTYFPATDTARNKPPLGKWTAVTPNYFETTGMRLSRGRTFAAGGADGASSVIVNQAMAHALWPNENPIGRCVRFDTPTNPCVAVIGVVQTAIMGHLDEKPDPMFYVSAERAPFANWGGTTMVVSASPDRIDAVTNGMRDLLRAEFPGAIPVTTTMASLMAPQYRPWELGAKLFTAFGFLALVVATIGVYSSVSYAVTQRTHEFGVRLALGARGVDVVRQVLGENLRTIVIGVMLGSILTLAAGGLLRSLLYGVEPSDPLSLGGVAIVLIVIALAAAFRPAWRASRCDPVSALRAE